jgi:hypothetical protein
MGSNINNLYAYLKEIPTVSHTEAGMYESYIPASNKTFPITHIRKKEQVSNVSLPFHSP